MTTSDAMNEALEEVTIQMIGKITRKTMLINQRIDKLPPSAKAELAEPVVRLQVKILKFANLEEEGVEEEFDALEKEMTEEKKGTPEAAKIIVAWFESKFMKYFDEFEAKVTEVEKKVLDENVAER